MNFHRNIRSVKIIKTDLCIDDYNERKLSWFNEKMYGVKRFGEIYSEYAGFEVVYTMSDAATYTLFLHAISSGNVYRISTYAVNTAEIIKIIDSIQIVSMS